MEGKTLYLSMIRAGQVTLLVEAKEDGADRRLWITRKVQDGKTRSKSVAIRGPMVAGFAAAVQEAAAVVADGR